ncbi:polar amino acid transport system permease protein [Hamadaea flava]|uniref:Amino acid ABC transporter permease n=1 Tax=Hamadaea flava TaxID=1742688 RepID=A0ABV8LUV7_9ACTN|nr:amino acid ABC transporter permease [Hamadaea flava]MCP2328055.1 polar amino acid transport system permease protein [Hamadaea flava]
MTQQPEPLTAVPVRHPGRWVAVGVIVVLAAMFAHLLITNDSFHWSFMVHNMFTPAVLRGLQGTLLMTVLAMFFGIALGILVAIARLSPNPVLRGVAWVYTWFFRAIPRLVLLALLGNLNILWPQISFGVPFDTYIGKIFGITDLHMRVFEGETRDLLSGFIAGLIGLALSEAAYMAEIVRAGMQSIDPGQEEAATALGMRRSQTLRRIVLPQAMRVIIPPTGNETIAMLKDTSLLIYVPVTAELFFQLSAIGSRTFLPFPMYVAASLWYLAIVSVLLIGQHFLERHFARGHRTEQARIRLAGIAGEQGGTL